MLGIDGDVVIQGLRTCVIMQMIDQHSPSFIGMHCMAQKTILVIHHISIVSKLEDLFKKLYEYFLGSFKCTFEFSNLVVIVKTKGLKMLRNMKTF
jgi:hypothetical protein